MLKPVDVVVVGSGISGASFAFLCAEQGLQVLVLEQADRVGGTLQSLNHDDFFVELGGHTCYNSYSGLIELIERAQLKSSLLERKKQPFRLWHHKKLQSIFSRLNFFEAALHFVRLFYLKKTNKTLQQFYSKVFGKNNYKHLLHYCFSSVLSQAADNYPAQLLFNKRPKRRKDIARSFSFKGGLAAIADGLLKHENISVLTSQQVITVNHESEHYLVQTTTDCFVTNKLALATSVQAATKLLAHIDKNLSDLLRSFSYSEVETYAVIVEARKLTLPLLAGIIAVEEDFYSMISADVLPHSTYRGFSFHFKPGKLSAEQKLKAICELLQISEADIVFSEQKQNYIPVITVEDLALIKKVQQQASKETLFLLGNYFNGIAIEDCVQRAMSEFKRLRDSQ